MGAGAARRSCRVLALAALLALPTLLAAPAAFAAQVMVLAASSLKEALDTLAHGYETRSGDKVVISYAGSNVLAMQVVHGAPADLFFAADTDWIDYVEQRGLAIRGSRRDLLGNELVLVAPASSRVSVRLVPGTNLAAALGDRRLALANPDAVPAGKYARVALTALGAWASVKDRVATVENVRAALLLVARGEAPLGVVYRSDALAEPRVRVVDAFPEGTHPPIVYPVVRLRHGTGAASVAFADYLGSSEARGIFERFGFRVP